MIKVYVRAIVPHKNGYLLMNDAGPDGNESWDLPGGELVGGKDVKEYLKRLVLQNTGYEISRLAFYEIVCKVRRRQHGVSPMTVLDFIFTGHVDSVSAEPGAKNTEILPFSNFEWLESDGRFRDNKVMSLLSNYHHKRRELDAAQLKQESEIGV